MAIYHPVGSHQNKVRQIYPAVIIKIPDKFILTRGRSKNNTVCSIIPIFVIQNITIKKRSGYMSELYFSIHSIRNRNTVYLEIRADDGNITSYSTIELYNSGYCAS